MHMAQSNAGLFQPDLLKGAGQSFVDIFPSQSWCVVCLRRGNKRLSVPDLCFGTSWLSIPSSLQSCKREPVASGYSPGVWILCYQSRLSRLSHRDHPQDICLRMGAWLPSCGCRHSFWQSHKVTSNGSRAVYHKQAATVITICQEEETRLGQQMEHKTLCPALGRGCLGEMHIPHPRWALTDLESLRALPDQLAF